MAKTTPTFKNDSKRSINAKSFFNSAFKEFSLYDNVRSIPSIFDGMKVSQRKVLYGVQLRGENAGELQVERLASSIAAATDYHHGAGSLASTIVGMANNYTGTNNMNLLEPSGQFGSRLTKEAASPRYILTKFSDNFRKLFKKEDDSILEHNFTDGEKIEPKYYTPLLPMVLVNGAQGTGTGHACLILNYHPTKVRDACAQVLLGEKIKRTDLIPWFKGFIGEVKLNEETGQVVVTGKLEVVNSTSIKITEIPVGVYLDNFKDHLNKLEESGFIKDYEDQSTEDGFEFFVNCPRSTTILEHDVLLQKFKLISRDTENFTLWNEDGVLERFESPVQIVERFVAWRLTKYEDRRQRLISNTNEQIEWSSMKIRFINFYLANTELFKNTGKKALVDLLIKNDFDQYDRLLQMPIWNLTKDKIADLEKELDELKKYLKTLEKDTADAMYARELMEFKYE